MGENGKVAAQCEEARPRAYNHVEKFIAEIISKEYQIVKIDFHVDRVQLSMLPEYRDIVAGMFGGLTRPLLKKNRMIYIFDVDGAERIRISHSRSKPYRFFLDLDDPTDELQASIFEKLKQLRIPYRLREVEIAFDMYPLNPAHVFAVRDLIHRHLAMPYGRQGQHAVVGTTDYWGNRGHKRRGSKGADAYIRPKEGGPKEFVRLELLVNQDHEAKGIQFPVDLGSVRYEKLVQFRCFDSDRALELAVKRLGGEKRIRLLNQHSRSGIRGEMVKAHLRSHLKEIRIDSDPGPRYGDEVLADQLDRYRGSPFFRPNDLGAVFPRVI